MSAALSRSHYDTERILFLENFCNTKSEDHVELDVTQFPGYYTVPHEISSYLPRDKDVYLYFNKNTEQEICVRQIFLNIKLTDGEMEMLASIRNIFEKRGVKTPQYLEQHLLRVCYYNLQRYSKETYLQKTYEHLLEMVLWRTETFPMSDSEKDLRHDLEKGLMYWKGRSEAFHPLLVVRMERFSFPLKAARLNRLIIFCFEWALRYLFVPGRVESCIVLFDLRHVPVHQFSLNTLLGIIHLLTYQYPFRLNHMHVLHDSFLLQSTWKLLRNCLSNIQQQKVTFSRLIIGANQLSCFTPHQLEKDYGGFHKVTMFYPFPLAPGPFYSSASTVNMNATRNEWKPMKTPKGSTYWVLCNVGDMDHVSPDILPREIEEMASPCSQKELSSTQEPPQTEISSDRDEPGCHELYCCASQGVNDRNTDEAQVTATRIATFVAQENRMGHDENNILSSYTNPLSRESSSDGYCAPHRVVSLPESCASASLKINNDFTPPSMMSAASTPDREPKTSCSWHHKHVRTRFKQALRWRPCLGTSRKS